MLNQGQCLELWLFYAAYDNTRARLAPIEVLGKTF